MERSGYAIICAVAAAGGATLLLTEVDMVDLIILVLIGIGVAGAVMTGYGGQCLLLCLGEAYSMGLGTSYPALGVAFQPVIAGIVCREDRGAFGLGTVMMMVFSVGVLLFKHMITPLIILIVVLASVILGLILFENRLHHRLSGGDSA